MTPAPSRAVGGDCLSDGSTTMLCLAEGEQEREKDRHLTLNLMGLSGPLAAHWVNAWTGERKALGTLQAAVVTVDYPADFGGAPAILVLRR